LYRGAFLEGFSLHDSPEFDTWSALVREELQRRALTTLSQIAEGYEQQGKLEEASQYARRQLELEPWLEDAFRLPTVGTRTALPRHQTLRAAMDWSYNLLDENERLLLQRLTAFAGGFTLEAAEAVCGSEGLEKDEILDLLMALVNKSLVVAKRQQGEETRYELLETVRQYGLEKVLATGESQWLSNRHWDYYMWLAEQAEPQLRSAGRIIWTHKLILEHHNTHQALE
jgi:predicted ATPase